MSFGQKYLIEAVDNHDGVVWLAPGVVDDVKVNELLYFKVVHLKALDDGLEREETSFPIVMNAMVFFKPSILFSFLVLFRASFNSLTSPFLFVVL